MHRSPHDVVVNDLLRGTVLVGRICAGYFFPCWSFSAQCSHPTPRHASLLVRCYWIRTRCTIAWFVGFGRNCTEPSDVSILTNRLANCNWMTFNWASSRSSRPHVLLGEESVMFLVLEWCVFCVCLSLILIHESSHSSQDPHDKSVLGDLTTRISLVELQDIMPHWFLKVKISFIAVSFRFPNAIQLRITF